MPTQFGEWLAYMLGLRDMSQKELADATGVTPAAVNGWVNGRSAPRSDKVLLIAEALNVSAEDALHRRLPSSALDALEWVFRAAPEDGGREGGSAAGFAFSASLDVLAREATQNSIDEQLPGGPPVRVSYTLHELSGAHLDEFKSALGWDSVEKHIAAAANPSQKVGRVLQDGLRRLESERRIVLLRVDDYHATGLTGPEFGDGRFSRVVRRTLDSGKASGQGGSYGLGKAALWAASRFGLVLVHSTLSEPEDGRTDHRISGRLELPWHTVDGTEYAGPAWLGIPDAERNNTARSWWGDAEGARSLYLDREDDTPGTSFLVVGAYDGTGTSEGLDGMYDRLVDSLSKNFWASMVSGKHEDAKLRCSVTAYRNGEPARERVFIDPHAAEPARAKAVQAFLDGTTVEEFTERNQVLKLSVPLELRSPKDDAESGAPGIHEAVLLIASTDEDDPNRDHISFMRSTRMVVRNKRVRELPLGHRTFQAVLLAGEGTLDGSRTSAAAELMLRASEPPDHNDWTGTEDLTATYEVGARQRILDFKNEAEQRIRDALRPPQDDTTSDEGPAVLRELLRLTAPGRARPLRTQTFPTVKGIHGKLDGDGAWDLTVTVMLPHHPSGDDGEPRVLEVKPKLLTRSSASARIQWKELIPLEGCELSPEGNILCLKASGQIRFRGVTDAASHQVPSAMSRVTVDVRPSQEVVA